MMSVDGVIVHWHLHISSHFRGWDIRLVPIHGLGDVWYNGQHICFPCLPPVLECRFESQLGLEFSGFSMWHFLKVIVRGFLWLLWFPSLLHRWKVSAHKIKLKCDFNSFKLSRWAVPFYQVAHCLLHTICTQLCPGHLSVFVGDSLGHSEIVNVSLLWFVHNFALVIWVCVGGSLGHSEIVNVSLLWFVHNFTLVIWVFLLEAVWGTVRL